MSPYPPRSLKPQSRKSNSSLVCQRISIIRSYSSSGDACDGFFPPGFRPSALVQHLLVDPSLGALQELALQEHHVQRKLPRLDVVTKAWRKYVIKEDGSIDRKAYTVCCLDRVRAALRRRDLFVTPSLRYADARLGLLSGPAWEGARTTVCRSLGHSLSPEESLTAISQQLGATYAAQFGRFACTPW